MLGYLQLSYDYVMLWYFVCCYYYIFMLYCNDLNVHLIFIKIDLFYHLLFAYYYICFLSFCKLIYCNFLIYLVGFGFCKEQLYW